MQLLAAGRFNGQEVRARFGTSSKLRKIASAYSPVRICGGRSNSRTSFGVTRKATFIPCAAAVRSSVSRRICCHLGPPLRHLRERRKKLELHNKSGRLQLNRSCASIFDHLCVLAPHFGIVLASISIPGRVKFSSG